MDNIYPPRYKSITQIGKFATNYRSKLGLANAVPNTNDEVAELIGFTGSADEFDDLCSSISIENLSQPDDIRVIPFDPSKYMPRKRSNVLIPKAALKLKTVTELVQSQGVYSEKHKDRYLKYNKYKHLSVDVDNFNADIDPLQESILTVRVYEPFVYKPNSSVRMKPKLSQEFLVLGTQYLSELRDQIFCPCNFGPFFDISNNPNLNQPPQSSKNDKGFDHGFFFIGDTFYNDTRKPTIDYSDTIRTWSKKCTDITDELKTASMERTIFDSLTVRLGYPQVYIHHGNCEHLFTFSDVRLIGRHDNRCRSVYPLLRTVSSTRSIFCVICGTSEASIIVANSSKHIHDTTYLCQLCFESYHYIDGKKVGEFEAYRYYGNRPIVNS